MALDNAQFISELSITDPPGTDAVAEGDDHIRTVKRATQQSFPNVNAAVPQTAAQMGQMAIKNEANDFTTLNRFQNTPTQFADGAEATPGVTFVGQTNTGMFRPNSTTLAFSVGAVQKLSVGVGAINSQVPYGSVNGSAAFPAYAFAADNTSGMYKPGTSLGFSVAGADAAFLLPGQFRMISDGIAAAPAYSFQGSQNMGMFRQFATSLGFAVGGTQAFAMLVNQLRSISNGSAVAPAYSFNSGSGDMGMYRLAGDQLAFVVEQVTRFIIKGNTFTMANLPTGPGGLLVTGDLYAKQSQLFAGTELVMGVQP